MQVAVRTGSPQTGGFIKISRAFHRSGIKTVLSFRLEVIEARRKPHHPLRRLLPHLSIRPLLGQVISGKRFWPDGTPVAGQQFEYGFDDIGNRQTAAHGGNAVGSNLRVETYTANDLNPYTQRTVPGFSEVQGRARSDATVTVNLQAATRQGPYWRSELMTDNSASPVWLGITNVAVLRGAGAGGTDLVASNTGTLFLPQTPETYLHDADGNLTRDGRWTNYWDAENRLIRTESLGLEIIRTSTFDIRNSKVRQDWSHLPDGRWSQRVIYSWTDNDWLPQATNRFLWDGQVLLAVLNGANQPEQTYLRGLDLSGTMQGAGGVGGLLAVNLGTTGTHFACFDGNGNVATLVSATTGGETARYEYDPFGNTLRATGPAAEANSLRFSTQFADDLTRRVKYLYRDYDAGMGRWNSRDPIEEKGGINIYVMLHNHPTIAIDYLGLATLDSVTKAMQYCLKKPTIAQQIECLELYFESSTDPKTGRLIKKLQKQLACGSCTPAEYATLGLAVGVTCKGIPGSKVCTLGETEAALSAKLLENWACFLARLRMNRRCFGGGDATHRAEATAAFDRAGNCLVQLTASGFKAPPLPY